MSARLRSYVDERAALAEAGTDEPRAAAASQAAIALHGELWSRSTALVRERPDADACAPTGFLLELQARMEQGPP